MNLRMSSGRAAYLRQQDYAKRAVDNIQRHLNNKKYGAMKEAQKRENSAKLKLLVEYCEERFSCDNAVLPVLKPYFERWEANKFGRNFYWGLENLRRELSVFSSEVNQTFENIVKDVEEGYEKRVREEKKRKEREEFKKKFFELQQQRKQAGE